MVRWAKRAARPDFMYDKTHLIWSWSEVNSDCRRLKYRRQEVMKALPFDLSPSKLSGVAALGRVRGGCSGNGKVAGRRGGKVSEGGGGSVGVRTWSFNLRRVFKISFWISSWPWT